MKKSRYMDEQIALSFRQAESATAVAERFSERLGITRAGKPALTPQRP